MFARLRLKILLTVVAALFCALPLSAAEPAAAPAPALLLWTPGEPLDISAENMRFESDNSRIVFEENVRLTQSGLELRCHKLTLISASGGALAGFTAEGALEIERDGLKIRAMRADYNHASRHLALSGSPEVERGSDLVRGQRITIDFAGGTVTVEKAQARVRLQNNQAEKTNNE